MPIYISLTIFTIHVSRISENMMRRLLYEQADDNNALMFDSLLFFSGYFYDPSRTFLPLLFRILNDFLSTHVPRAWRFNGCSRTHLNL